MFQAYRKREQGARCKPWVQRLFRPARREQVRQETPQRHACEPYPRCARGVHRWVPKAALTLRDGVLEPIVGSNTPSLNLRTRKEPQEADPRIQGFLLPQGERACEETYGCKRKARAPSRGHFLAVLPFFSARGPVSRILLHTCGSARAPTDIYAQHNQEPSPHLLNQVVLKQTWGTPPRRQHINTHERRNMS